MLIISENIPDLGESEDKVQGTRYEVRMAYRKTSISSFLRFNLLRRGCFLLASSF